MLQQLGLEFPLKILSDDLGAGKPDPKPYRVALEQLGLEAKEALAFEDSPTGVRSAKEAGIATVAITSGHSREALVKEGADLLVADFADSALWAYLNQL
jgi:beta-phosphoglucomutase-like phosphatase (HAD superfamily)